MILNIIVPIFNIVIPAKAGTQRLYPPGIA